MKHSPGFQRLVEDALARVRELTVDETAPKVGKPDTYLVDVREESEWNEEHADGAIHLGKGVIERDIEVRIPDRDATIMLYCGGGYRSALAGDNLQKMGYRNVFSVAGGWRAWKSAGKPTTTRPEVVPRSPYEKLGGIVHLPRLIDKARLFPKGKLPGYQFLNTGFDRNLLDFLCVEGRVFADAIKQLPDDESVLQWLKNRLGPSWPGEHAITEFNEKLSRRRPDQPDRIAKFEKDRAALPPCRKKIETYFDLIDLEEGRLK
ncbi:hypothetical protein DB346_16745 [Verrucomicrobia bacterium LW23]|nr:hypothetical protein DB346_16745 [Verrucomicrobia bacterium LW23]